MRRAALSRWSPRCRVGRRVVALVAVSHPINVFSFRRRPTLNVAFRRRNARGDAEFIGEKRLYFFHFFFGFPKVNEVNRKIEMRNLKKK